jgi:hypothetical protein
MAKATIKLIEALLETSNQLEKGINYQWGHMGSCNCGHLAQVITGLTKERIHLESMHRSGDWKDQLRDYCPQSGLPMDVIIDKMIEAGFTANDLIHLERLSDSKILKKLPTIVKQLNHNSSKDAALYMRCWAKLMEEEIIENMELPDWNAHILVKA